MASIQKWRGGRYRAHWRNDEGRPQSKVFDYKADAIAHLDRVDAALERGTYVSPGHRRQTVAQYVTGSWLPAQAWRPATRELFDSQWRKHIEPRWADAPLASIRRTALQAWVNELGETLAPATAEGVYRRLVSILRAAVDDDILDKLPTARIKVPKTPSSKTKLAVPTPAEVEAITGVMTPHYKAIVATIATLGLRPGEAIGLTVERVNFLKREVVVDRQLVTRAVGSQGPTLGPPKTDAGNRTLPAPPELLDRLAAHIDEYGTLELEPGATLIFQTSRNAPVRRGVLVDAWHRAARKVDLRGELRGWHSLRHYAITTLIAAGVNPDYVRQFAGHESLSQTLDIYSGWWPSDADEARDVLAAALERRGTA